MTNDNAKDNSFMEMLEGLITEVFSKHSKDESLTPKPASPVEKQPKTALYESIEDYTEKTGKRFRMTKDQKNLGLTREEAFSQTFGAN